MKPISVFVLITFFVVALFSSQNIASAHGLSLAIDTPTPTTTPTPTASAIAPSSMTTILITPTPSIDDRVAKLEENYLSSAWIILLEKGDLYCWPAILFAFILIFNKQVSTFLSRLASVADRATFEFMGAKWSNTDLSTVVIEREILKTIILVAAADGNFQPNEIQHLRDIASSMVTKLDEFPQEAKDKVLQEAIIMATTDGVIQDEELDALKLHADDFGIDLSKLEDMIIKKCILDNVTPPDILKPKYEQVKNRLRP